MFKYLLCDEMCILMAFSKNVNTSDAIHALITTRVGDINCNNGGPHDMNAKPHHAIN